MAYRSYRAKCPNSRQPFAKVVPRLHAGHAKIAVTVRTKRRSRYQCHAHVFEQQVGDIDIIIQILARIDQSLTFYFNELAIG